MRIKVIPHVYDSFIREYVVIPLDDAEPSIIQLARAVHGRDVTAKEFRRLLNDLNIDEEGSTGFRVDNGH